MLLILANFSRHLFGFLRFALADESAVELDLVVHRAQAPSPGLQIVFHKKSGDRGDHVFGLLYSTVRGTAAPRVEASKK